MIIDTDLLKIAIMHYYEALDEKHEIADVRRELLDLNIVHQIEMLATIYK